MKNPDAVIVFPPPMDRIARVYPAPHFLSSFINNNGFSAKPLDLNILALSKLTSPYFLDEEIKTVASNRAWLETSGLHSQKEKQAYAASLRSFARLLYGRRIHSDHHRIKNLMDMENCGIRYTRIFIDLFKKYFGLFYKKNIPETDDLKAFFSCPEAIRIKALLHDQIQRSIIDKQIPVIGFSIPFAQQFIPAMILASEIKKKMPDVHISFGGPIITLLPETYLNAVIKVAPVDSFVRYDGEMPLLQVLRHKLRDQAVDDTKNVILHDGLNKSADPSDSFCHRNDKQVHTHNRFQKENMGYFSKNAPIPVTQSTGCYWKKCSFCDYINLHKDKIYRPRPVSEIIADIKYYHSLKFTNFRMLAEAIHPKHAFEIATALLDNNLNISWHSFLRVDAGFTTKILQSMAKSGFSCTIGMESANECVLQTLNKGYNKKIIRGFFENLRAASLKNNHLNVIVGTPGATYDQELETFAFCKEYTDIFTQFKCSIFTLTQTSDMGKNPHKYGLRIKDSSTDNQHLHGRILSMAFDDPNGMTHEKKLRIVERYGQLNKEIKNKQKFKNCLDRITAAGSGADIKGIAFVFEKLLVRQRVMHHAFCEQGDYIVVNMSESRDHHIFIDKQQSDIMDILRDSIFSCQDVMAITQDENIALHFIKKMAAGNLIKVADIDHEIQ
ncbi:MAG: hypothetical protein K9K40_01265 [Desulfotignum sp.]|nr:hypothetical protein [Desulfotignum sp.]